MRQNLSRNYSIREIVYVMQNDIQNSNGAEQVFKRKIMALLTGRTEQSIKNIAKKIHGKKGCTKKEILEMWYMPFKSKNGT